MAYLNSLQPSLMDYVDDHFERLELSKTALYCLFEERGLEVSINEHIDLDDNSLNYIIQCQLYIFTCKIKLWSDYKVIDKIWECYRQIDEKNIHWLDSCQLLTFIKNNKIG